MCTQNLLIVTARKEGHSQSVFWGEWFPGNHCDIHYGLKCVATEGGSGARTENSQISLYNLLFTSSKRSVLARVPSL